MQQGGKNEAEWSITQNFKFDIVVLELLEQKFVDC